MNKPKRFSLTPEEAKLFWSQVKRQGQGCWFWRGDERGKHGFFWVASLKRSIGAHRVAFFLVHGQVPEGKMIRHRCDWASCVNPDHLEAGSARDNALDMTRNNRLGRTLGDRRYKLTTARVQDIRRCAAAGESPYRIAQRYSVSTDMVRSVVAKRTWAHVPDWKWADPDAERKRAEWFREEIAKLRLAMKEEA